MDAREKNEVKDASSQAGVLSNSASRVVINHDGEDKGKAGWGMGRDTVSVRSLSNI